MPCQIVVFPMSKRIGRIREVADKMLDKPTERSARHYRKVVTDAALGHMERAGLTREQQARELSEFWQAVEAEIVRQSYVGQHPGAA